MSDATTTVTPKKRPSGVFFRKEIFERLTDLKEGRRTLDDLLIEMTPRSRGRASTLSVSVLQGYTDSLLQDKRYSILSANSLAEYVASKYNTKEGIKTGSPINGQRVLMLVKAGKLTGFPALRVKTPKTTPAGEAS